MSEEPRYTPKELAHKLRRNVSYVYRMRARGFPMPGGMQTMSFTIQWLADNPPPWRRKPKAQDCSVMQ